MRDLESRATENIDDELWELIEYAGDPNEITIGDYFRVTDEEGYERSDAQKSWNYNHKSMVEDALRRRKKYPVKESRASEYTREELLDEIKQIKKDLSGGPGKTSNRPYLEQQLRNLKRELETVGESRVSRELDDPEKKLLDFLRMTPNANGEDALAYMTAHGIDETTATNTIMKYGHVKEGAEFDPKESPLTIVNLMKYGLEVNMTPKLIIDELILEGVKDSTIAKALSIMNVTEIAYQEIDHADLIQRAKIIQKMRPGGRLTHEDATRIAYSFGIKENDVYRVLGYYGEVHPDEIRMAKQELADLKKTNTKGLTEEEEDEYYERMEELKRTIGEESRVP